MKPLEKKKRLRSAAVPPFRFGELKDRLSALEESVQALSEGMDEWQDHIANWRFSPERFAAELIMAAVQPELREYMREHPCPEHWPGSQFVVTPEWGEAFLQWLDTQPVAARLIRRARCDITCFQVAADSRFQSLLEEALLEHVRQRSFEPWDPAKYATQYDADLSAKNTERVAQHLRDFKDPE